MKKVEATRLFNTSMWLRAKALAKAKKGEEKESARLNQQAEETLSSIPRNALSWVIGKGANV